MPATDVDRLATSVVSGGRRALAQAITLVESTRPDDKNAAGELLDRILDRTGGAIRVGVSGAPGSGKSTFIEAYGSMLLEQGKRLAVLAIDPSSSRSGGSILGDKTRMEALARHPHAYVRPSPSGGALGGVARRTRDAILLCEAAGFDAVLVETVGVGQSETEVDNLVDVFVLLVSPGTGDELQGIKRGVMELADIVVVTKADGHLLDAAHYCAAEYGHALRLMRPKHEGWNPPVLVCSALTGQGIAGVAQAVADLWEHLAASSAFESRRASQATSWLWAEVTDELLDRFRRDTRVRAHLAELEADVASGRLSPGAAAQLLLDRGD